MLINYKKSILIKFRTLVAERLSFKPNCVTFRLDAGNCANLVSNVTQEHSGLWSCTLETKIRRFLSVQFTWVHAESTNMLISVIIVAKGLFY